MQSAPLLTASDAPNYPTQSPQVSPPTTTGNLIGSTAAPEHPPPHNDDEDFPSHSRTYIPTKTQWYSAQLPSLRNAPSESELLNNEVATNTSLLLRNTSGSSSGGRSSIRIASRGSSSGKHSLHNSPSPIAKYTSAWRHNERLRQILAYVGALCILAMIYIMVVIPKWLLRNDW